MRDPKAKILWVVNPTHELIKPPKFRQNLGYWVLPSVCLLCEDSVNAIKVYLPNKSTSTTQTAYVLRCMAEKFTHEIILDLLMFAAILVLALSKS